MLAGDLQGEMSIERKRKTKKRKKNERSKGDKKGLDKPDTGGPPACWNWCCLAIV